MAKSVVLPKASTLSLIKKIIRSDAAVDKAVLSAEKALEAVAQKRTASEELVSQLLESIESADGDDAPVAAAKKAPATRKPAAKKDSTRKPAAKKAPAKKASTRKATTASKGPAAKRGSGRKAPAKKAPTKSRRAASKASEDFDDDFDI